MKIKPISPDEIVSKKMECIPDEVIEAFNEIIAESWNGCSAIFSQDDVIAKIFIKLPYTNRERIFAMGWLNVEALFEAEGWEIDYDKPGYNETYKATFRFSKK